MVEPQLEQVPVGLADLPAGISDVPRIAPGSVARIMTGAPIPEGADAVVPLEQTDRSPEQLALFAEPLPGAFIRRAGSDMASGDRVLPAVLERAAVALAAESVGGAQRCLDMAVAYAKERVQFGRPIGSFQALKHQMADMFVAVESARSISYAAAHAVARDPGPAGPDPTIAAARIHCARAAAAVAGEAVQMHGGIGITWEHDVQLYFKRAHTGAQLFGRPQTATDGLARSLGL